MALGCAGLLIYTMSYWFTKATVLIILMGEPYNQLLIQKFNLATMKPNLHHLFCFVDLGQNLQYEGHYYRDGRVMSKIQNKIALRIIL